MDINDTLTQRGKTHGDFGQHAEVTQLLKEVMYASSGWQRLTHAQRESLDMIAHKIGRILAGDPNYPDHIHDIIGYAELYSRALIARG